MRWVDVIEVREKGGQAFRRWVREYDLLGPIEVVRYRLLVER
jgi:hypothetical protein